MSAPAFVFDLNRCTGCHACAIACGIENAPERLNEGGLDWRRIDTMNEAKLPGIASFSLSLACNHCAKPACLLACPAEAYTKDAATGAVLVDGGRCIGCRYCTWACPYDAPRFNERAGVVEKCTFCRHRLLAGERPACVVACPTGALELGEVAEGTAAPGAAADGIPGFRETDLGPAIRFVPLRGPAVQVALERPADLLVERVPRTRSKITLRGEWTLFAFSTVVLALTAVFAAAIARDLVPSLAGAIAFAATGLAALGLSTSHLGRPARAWRAARNWRTSWLSREVIFAGSFIGLASLWMVAVALAGGEGGAVRFGSVPAARTAGWAIAALGLAAAFCVDRVYSVILPPTGLRTGNGAVGPVLAGSLYLAALLAAPAWVWAPVGVLRGILALDAGPRAVGRGARALTAMRLATGIAGAMTMRALVPGAPGDAAVFVFAMAGELIERARFYESLVVTTPRLEMEAALEKLQRGLSKSTGTGTS